MHPIVVVLLDGLADRAHDSLGGHTANEVADTPNLDRLAAEGSNGVLFSLGPGCAPSSELAHWRILGYRPEEFPGRAVFEAVGVGQEVDPAHVFAYAALRPADVRNGELWLTGRPGHGEDEEEARRLVQSCDGLEVDGLRFSLAHTRRGEAVLRIEGGADDRVTDTDAFFRDRHPVLRPRAQVPEAERTARAVERWTRAVIERLEGERFNVITLKWWGRPRAVPTFEERHGLRGTFVAESAFLRGLAGTVGLAGMDEPESDEPAADLRRRLVRIEERLGAGDDFVFVHMKATDMAGHTKDPAVKRATIEALDTVLERLHAVTERAIVAVTGDHATPTYPDVIHSGDPVPFVLNGPGVRADAVESFGELPAAAGILGHLRGEDVMPVLLNAADRPLFAGSRPTPYAGADGYPSLLEPLRIH
jgi:2,3-bisphosphoglycerate-independent phosphoglycerate mutase